MFKDQVAGRATVGIRDYKITVTERCPFPVIRLELSMVYTRGRTYVWEQNRQIEKSTIMTIYPNSVIFRVFNGYAKGEPDYKRGYSIFYEHSVNIPITHDFIDYIESRREGDFPFALIFEFGFQEKFDINNREYIRSGFDSLEIREDFSAKNWATLLQDLGYSEKWVVELDTPKIGVSNKVKENIEKAQVALLNKNDPEDVIRDLRSARISFRPIYDEYKEKIGERIERGSMGDSERKRSESAMNNYDSLCKFLNIGTHNSNYHVTYEDALFAYREFISSLSYLGSIISSIEETRNKPLKN